MPFQILNRVMQPQLWRYVGFLSSVVGLLCYALSSSFNHLFGDWNLLKIFLYSLVSFIISGSMLYVKKWQRSTSLLFKAHVAVVVLTLTSVYSFFYDKAVNGKPDALSLISWAAFALMSLSLSRQTHFGFEVDLLYFFLGYFIVQLMKIKLSLGLVGAGFSYSVIILRSTLDSRMENRKLGIEDHAMVIQSNYASSNGFVQVDSGSPGDDRVAYMLMYCAEALQHNDFNLAETIMNEVGTLASSQAGAMTKVEYYFSQAFARRINGIYFQETLDSSLSNKLYMNFYESCPYLKFAHFTANQAILEAFATADKVHVIDLGLEQGKQWPALMHALKLRPGGPPYLRLTGIGPPQPQNTNPMQLVGWKLTEMAEAIGIKFEFHGLPCDNLADLDSSMLDVRPGEAVAVNSVFELHRTLASSGGIEKVLNTIKATEPKIVAMVEQEANHNGSTLVERFTEAYEYYSNVFGLLEESSSSAMSEAYVGREICNVVGCEGEDRVERHETLSQWKGRMVSAGFEAVHLGSNALMQANMLLALSTGGGDDYWVEDNNGCLMLGSHERPLIVTSAWKIPVDESSLLALRLFSHGI